MRRLYLQVYFTIVASLVLVVLTAGLVWHFFAGMPPFNQPFAVAGEVIGELVLPAPGRNSGPWMRTSAGPAIVMSLPGGRRLVARLPPRGRPTALFLITFL